MAIDYKNHVPSVLTAAENAGLQITNVVALDSIGDAQGNYPAEKVTSTLAAIVEGSNVFNPGQPVYVNMSDGVGWRQNGHWQDVTTLTPAQQQQGLDAWENMMIGKLQGIANLPPDLSSKLVITQAAGNSNLDVGPALQDLESDPTYKALLSTTVLIVATHLKTTDANYPTGDFSNFAQGDSNVGYSDNTEAGGVPGGSWGTSFAAPAALALVKKVIDQTGVTRDQALLAVKTAAAANSTHNVVLAEAVAQANNIKQAGAPTIGSGPPPQNFRAVEAYKGNVAFNATITGPQAANCQPAPLVITFKGAFSGFELDVASPLATAGPFVGLVQASTFSGTTTTPTQTCTNPDGSTTTVPGMSQTNSVPATGGGISGHSDGTTVSFDISPSGSGCTLTQPGLTLTDTATSVTLTGSMQLSCTSGATTLVGAWDFSLTKQ